MHVVLQKIGTADGAKQVGRAAARVVGRVRRLEQRRRLPRRPWRPRCLWR
jgi:hypothetical protein